jgi:hypothetical protein
MSIGSLLYKPRLCPMTDGPVFPIIARCQKLISSVNLFPLSVYISDVAQHPSLKDGLVPRIKALQPYQPESRYAWTGDVNGHGFIHLDEDFKAWLGAMVPHIQRYLELLQLRTEYPDIYFQRSWPAGESHPLPRRVRTQQCAPRIGHQGRAPPVSAFS